MCYADVDNKGGGVVHFNNKEGMDYALRKLDGSEFSNRYDSATISVSRLLDFFVVSMLFWARRSPQIFAACPQAGMLRSAQRSGEACNHVELSLVAITVPSKQAAAPLRLTRSCACRTGWNACG